MSSAGPLGMPIPPGVSEDDPRPVANRPETIYGVCITLVILAWIGASCRLGTRLLITKSPGADDSFIVVTLVLFSVLCVAVLIAPSYGLGQHTAFLDAFQLSKLIMCQYLFGIGYSGSVATIKISLLFQFLRVFKKYSWQWWIAAATQAITCGWGFAMLFIAIFPCLPRPDAWWNGTMKGCYGLASPNQTVAVNLILGHGASNLILDTVVFSLAFMLQFETDVPAKRGAARALFLVGACSWALAVWRLAEIVESKGAGVAFDPAFEQPSAYLISVAEVCLAALYATIPFFWPVITALNQIFVKYEFEVSSESRWPDAGDEIELARSGTAASHKHGPIRAGSPVNSHGATLHYKDPYIQSQLFVAAVPVR
ncbi:hypothetical protein GE09DRAFT_1215047 [Coniochaeta sp. 2T2.1]|nr:hypothetical protein GE09DRAFT_1215047 [Coniochaeta sp. 2T2.1]